MLAGQTPNVMVERISPHKCDMHVRLYREPEGDLTLAIMGMTESRQFTLSSRMRCCTWRLRWREGYRDARLNRLSDPESAA